MIDASLMKCISLQLVRCKKKKKKNLHRKQAEHSAVLVVTDVTLWQRKQ